MRTLPALLLLAASCAAPAAGEAAARAQAERLMRAWRTGDVSDLAEYTTEDVVYDDAPNGRLLEGREAFAGYVNHVHAWAGDVGMEVTRIHAGDGWAAAEWIMTGVQDAPIAGRVPVATNRAFRLRGVTLVELRDGRIARAADYLDALGFVLQLGSTVELPGGARIP